MRKEENDQDDDVDGPVIDESTLSAKELLGLQQAEERLKRDFIYRLRKVTISALLIIFFVIFWYSLFAHIPEYVCVCLYFYILFILNMVMFLISLNIVLIILLQRDPT